MSAPSSSPHRLRLHERLAVRLVWWLLCAWNATLRLRFPPETAAILRRPGTPCVVAFWHNQLLLVPHLRRTYQRASEVHGLVSASRDGAWLAELFRLNRVRTIRGSTSQHGREALHGVVASLRAGALVAITPDGPRGPAYSVAPGVILAARRARVPLVLWGATFARAWRVDSWDGFLLPRPFTTVEVRAAVIEPDELAAADDPAELVARRLHALSHNDTLHPPPPRMARSLAVAAARRVS